VCRNHSYSFEVVNQTLTIITLKSQAVCFGGTVDIYEHHSAICHGSMQFAVYVPPQAKSQAVPVLYFLSGLTCTPENFITKAGAQQFAAQHGVMLVVPDTSPRQTGTANEDLAGDLGTGAGFYVDATEQPWAAHYQMYSYVTVELPALIAANFSANMERQGIFGHSMGGHGALVCALRNPGKYRSVSAFAPIVAPMSCAWGQKALQSYLGDDKTTWTAYDASKLVLNQQLPFPILIDQGSADSFLQDQLKPEIFVAACQQANQVLNFRMQEGYDHSYYFISTFMADHLKYHAQLLND
jgi:S-formylglutathione hydrolase